MKISGLIILLFSIVSFASEFKCPSGELLAKTSKPDANACVCGAYAKSKAGDKKLVSEYWVYEVKKGSAQRAIVEPEPGQFPILLGKSGENSIEMTEMLEQERPLLRTIISCKEKCILTSSCAFPKPTPRSDADPLGKYLKDGKLIEKMTDKNFVLFDSLFHKEYMAAIDGNSKALSFFLNHIQTNEGRTTMDTLTGLDGSLGEDFDIYVSNLHRLRQAGCL